MEASSPATYDPVSVELVEADISGASLDEPLDVHNAAALQKATFDLKVRCAVIEA